MNDQNKLMTKQLLDEWNRQLNRASKLFNELTEDQIQKEVAPGRNTGTYL